ncbi:hypothetical protein BJ165DRAFT_1319058, partial [Panaeolus papilionaceus]
NTPIERLWVELGRRLCRAWRVFFIRLGHLHHLDKENPVHRWLLDYLFLDMINEDCRIFVEEWNAHPMRNRHNKCPNVKMLRFYQYPKESAGSGDEADSNEGDMEDSEPTSDLDDENADDDEDTWTDSDHDDNLEDVDPTNDTFQDSDDEDEHQVDPAEDVDPNIHHKAVDIPGGNCPFNKATLAAFKTCIESVYQGGDIPGGYGVRSDEWEDGYYSETEGLAIGRSQKIKTVRLPNHIWLPRAQLWVQALCLLQT